MSTFDKLQVNEQLIKALTKNNIDSPTEIQEKAIPVILNGSNVMAQSETGTGKTLAYLLPVMQQIDFDKKEMQCVILSPTHELSVQICNVIRKLSSDSSLPIKCAALIGSANIKRQIEKLKEKPQIIVGSSGRILELIQKKKITSHTIKKVVIDEGDILLDDNNYNGICEVLKTMKNVNQYLLFSATISDETKARFKKIVDDFCFIKIKGNTNVNRNITHYYFQAEKRDKIDVLRKIIHAVKPKKALVFVNGNYDINNTLQKLRYNKIEAVSICGDNFKNTRQKAIEDFRKGRANVLVSSDITARGLDIDDITHVINLDVPEDYNSYLHRAGRTARSGKKGFALSIVTEKEEKSLKNISKKLNIIISKKVVYMGQIVDTVPKKKMKKDKYAYLKQK